MRKRPLCLAALLLTLVFLLLPARIWMNPEPLPEGREGPEFLTGEIVRIEPGGKAVSLNRTNLSDTGISLVYLNAEPPFSVCTPTRVAKNFELT